MPKQVIVIMDDHYPFGQCEQSTNENTRVLVRKIYQVSVQQKNKLLEKANILKRLRSQQLIKLQSVLQQQESIHFLFQYVPIRLQTWISNINDQFILNFRDQVIKFSSYLANNFIRIQFRLKNIGMDHNYGAKYFLDPSLVYDPSLNKEKLKSQYIRDISNLFKPYIDSSHEEQKPVYTQVSSPQQNYLKPPPLQNKNSISPPTAYQYQQQQQYKDPAASKTKEKLEKYYQHMNASMDVENEKILKQFMDVLDDQEEEQHHHVAKGGIANQHQQNNRNQQQQQQFQFGYDSDRKPQSKPQLPQHPIIQPNQQYQQYQQNQQYQQYQQNQQRNIFQPQPQKQQAYNEIPTSKTATTLSSPKMNKNSPIMSQHHTEEQQVVWKDSDDLQDRIKRAIQNSKSIISRFKTNKQER